TSDMLFARYGGEEFVLALPSISLKQAVALAERMRAAMEAEPLLVPSGTINVTSSFGVTQAVLGNNDTLETLLRNADEALYISKRSGRNRVSATVSPQSG